jgi:hypothetical protein
LLSLAAKPILFGASGIESRSPFAIKKLIIQKSDGGEGIFIWWSYLFRLLRVTRGISLIVAPLILRGVRNNNLTMDLGLENVPKASLNNIFDKFFRRSSLLFWPRRVVLDPQACLTQLRRSGE